MEEDKLHIHFNFGENEPVRAVAFISHPHLFMECRVSRPSTSDAIEKEKLLVGNYYEQPFNYTLKVKNQPE